MLKLSLNNLHCLAMVALTWGTLGSAAIRAQETSQFNRDIRPILSSHCYHCHGPDEQQREADLRLDVADGIRQAFGDRDLDSNAAWQRLISQDPDEQMPPPSAHSEITETEITKLKRWITQGATFQEHWSFRSPLPPEIPNVANTNGVLNPIDAFVIARLESENLKPNASATRQELIRRLFLDLTGLPPKLADLDTFLADQKPGAYERLVDRLLASPRFGERMAIPWLDAARYADTNGFSIDDHRDMWLWREWVINAFNNNMPYDQFVTEQLAGDLLPNASQNQQLATGFLRNSMNTHEGGTLPQEYRVIYIADKVDTVATVFLGMTMRCAQCHDHKYDPITQKDYFKFFAFFDTAHEPGMGAENGNTEPILRMDGLLTQPQQFQADVQRRIATLRQHLIHPPELIKARDAWEQQVSGDKSLKTALAIIPQQRTTADWETINSAYAKTNPLWSRHQGTLKREITFLEKDLTQGKPSVMVMKEKGPRQTYVLTRGQYDLPDKKQPVQPGVPGILPPLQFEPTAATPPTALKINPWETALWIWDQPNGATTVQNDQPKFFRRSFQLPQLPTSATLRVTADNRCAPYINGHPLGTQQPWMTPGQYDIREHLVTGDNLIAIEAVNQGGPAGLLASLEIDGQVRLVSNERWQVSTERKDGWNRSGFPAKDWSSASPLGPYYMEPWNISGKEKTSHSHLHDRPSRLDLAHWLMASGNPLTARVAVNRYWQMLFGRGLVSTPNDFGSQGNYPTHPELLDWLALEFQQNGWNTKQLLKTILMSATYQQSSTAPVTRYRQDPQNELLARATRFRLPAEFIRDGALAIAGTLDSRVGGPSVYPNQPHGLWREISHFGYTKPFSAQAFYPSDATGQNRRSMYTFWKRTSPPPSMIAFDAPTREVCSVERSRTNTPLQALVLLNDPEYIDAARNLARATIAINAESVQQRIDFIFRRATSRLPDPTEQGILQARYKTLLMKFQKDRTATGDLAHQNQPELAAWTVLASTLLNLDEVITRE